MAMIIFLVGISNSLVCNTARHMTNRTVKCVELQGGHVKGRN